MGSPVRDESVAVGTVLGFARVLVLVAQVVGGGFARRRFVNVNPSRVSLCHARDTTELGWQSDRLTLRQLPATEASTGIIVFCSS